MTHTTKTDSKEVLHTQGNWYVDTNKYGDYTQIKAHPNKFICECTGREKEYQNEANAQLIVKAVNERQKLLDSNRELLTALEELVNANNGNGKSIMRQIEKAQTAINNAKNLNK